MKSTKTFCVISKTGKDITIRSFTEPFLSLVLERFKNEQFSSNMLLALHGNFL